MGLAPNQGKVRLSASDVGCHTATAVAQYPCLPTRCSTATEEAPNPMSKPETKEISKTYRGRRVVDDVSVFVQQGEVVGLLGPNGAGKTTSFYMIVGLISPDSGRVLVDEEDI